jgi:hypothetical protein
MPYGHMSRAATLRLLKSKEGTAEDRCDDTYHPLINIITAGIRKVHKETNVITPTPWRFEEGAVINHRRDVMMLGGRHHLHR